MQNSSYTLTASMFTVIGSTNVQEKLNK